MKAVTVDSFDAAPGFRDDQAVPTAPSAGIVVRVRASSVNPVDDAIASGMLRGMVEHDFPVVLGRDYAGTVYETGADGGDTRLRTRSSASFCTRTRPSTTEAGPR
jgi:NADPH:quinone reductase-like Zn-dependent oxidoreductase